MCMHLCNCISSKCFCDRVSTMRIVRYVWFLIREIYICVYIRVRVRRLYIEKRIVALFSRLLLLLFFFVCLIHRWQRAATQDRRWEEQRIHRRQNVYCTLQKYWSRNSEAQRMDTSASILFETMLHEEEERRWEASFMFWRGLNRWIRIEAFCRSDILLPCVTTRWEEKNKRKRKTGKMKNDGKRRERERASKCIATKKLYAKV